MNYRGLSAALCVMALLTPAPAHAWGFVAHRLIMARALYLLPPELKPLFERHRAEVVTRVVDPDMWRNVGWPDDPNHFLDLGAREYGASPYAALPRDYNAALEKFGRAVLESNGLLPWRATEMFGMLRRGFEDFKRQSPYTVSNIVLFTAVASHYVQDAYQPLHATINYDGRDTGQTGIHSRFERDLLERFGDRVRLTPVAPRAIPSMRDYMFDTLLFSNEQVDALLLADKEASRDRTTYDDQYYEAFFAKVRPLLEERLSSAISATAGMIMAAWEQAGRPTLRVDDVRPLERVPGPR